MQIVYGSEFNLNKTEKRPLVLVQQGVQILPDQRNSVISLGFKMMQVDEVG